MRVTIRKQYLQSLLERAFAVAAKTSSAPVLQSVQLSAGSTFGLQAVGGDGEITMVARTTQVDVAEDGEALMGSKLLDIVRAAPDTDIVLAVDPDGSAAITAGEAHWQLRLERDDYPPVGESHQASWRIKKDELLTALNACRPAIEADAVRVMFQFVQLTGTVMRATDGSRLHQVEFAAPSLALWPGRAVSEIIRRARTMVLDEIEAGETERAYTFKIDEGLLIATKYATEYPDVESHMLRPALANELKLTVERRALLDAVRRVGLVADEDTNFLSVELGGDRMVLSTSDKFGSKAREGLPVHWTGGPRRLGLNHTFLAELLGAVDDGQVEISLRDGERGAQAPLCLRSNGFIGVLVQLRPELGDAARGGASPVTAAAMARRARAATGEA